MKHSEIKSSIIEQQPITSTNTIENPWQALRQFTDARIGLGRAGISIPTDHLLAFQLAHARAQDAVHTPLDTVRLIQSLNDLTYFSSDQQPLTLHSKAEDRSEYLQRPDLGRQLSISSIDTLQENHSDSRLIQQEYDLAIVIVDGLSSLAIQDNAPPFIDALSKALKEDTHDWRLAPLTIVQQGRVAIGDPIGEYLNARCVLLLIGERPGLSSPDSLGLYMTWAPRKGLTDAARNCISNVRPAGLNYPEAVRKALYLLKESRALKLSGVNLKDRSNQSDHTLDNRSNSESQTNFLVAD